MIARHSATAHAAYHDLLSLLRDEAVSDIRGAPTRVVRGARAYWYDSYRIGSSVRKTYIGEDSPALRARLKRHSALKDEADERRKRRARLVRILRAEGFLRIDSASGALMAALARAGVFQLGGTVVGTHAFRLYEGELGLRYDFDRLAQTGDLDIASFERLSLALDDVVSEPLAKVLADFDFAAAPGLEPGKTWRWRQTRGDLLVEFLTPSFGEEEGLRPLAALGVEAQALHHLKYLIADPIDAVAPYRAGVLVRIPAPERLAVHKLIVADRRRGGGDALKSVKDRGQAAFLIEALAEDRPDDLLEAYQDALSRGPKWRARIEATLARMPETRAVLETLSANPG